MQYSVTRVSECLWLFSSRRPCRYTSSANSYSRLICSAQDSVRVVCVRRRLMFLWCRLMVAIVLWTLLLKVPDSLDAREPSLCILDLSFVCLYSDGWLFRFSGCFRLFSSSSVKQLVLCLIKKHLFHDPIVCLKVVNKHMNPIFPLQAAAECLFVQY